MEEATILWKMRMKCFKDRRLVVSLMETGNSVSLRSSGIDIWHPISEGHFPAHIEVAKNLMKWL